jgi:predicted RNase H-like HicB family nuclease
MRLTIALVLEPDGHWRASVQELPGAHVYGASQADVMARAQALADEILADAIQTGACDPSMPLSLTFVTA